MANLFIDSIGVSVGADPEFFVKSGDEFISGHTFPCGTKDKPRKTAHGKVQCDGVALEINVEPAFSADAFARNLRGALFDLSEIVTGWSEASQRPCYLVAEPVAVFGKEFLDRLPLHVRQLGCEPDYNAYTANYNMRPLADTPFRTGSGHIHIGWTENAEGFEHFDRCMTLVRQLDYTVGLRTLLFDAEPRRRMLYGKAGAFRPKPYGVEYRVPSNAWCASEDLAKSMFEGVMKGIDLLNRGRDLDTETHHLARDCIDNNKVDWAATYPKLADLIIG